jgi:site-specific DNA-methyltransferase (adenine-specific)
MIGILHIVVARKPIEGTVAGNCLVYGCGALNIDDCRIKHNEKCRLKAAQAQGNKVFLQAGRKVAISELKEGGRWPANLILDQSEEVASGFPNDNPGCKPHWVAGTKKYEGWGSITKAGKVAGYNDEGNTSAARYFFNYSEQETDEVNYHALKGSGLRGVEKPT